VTRSGYGTGSAPCRKMPCAVKVVAALAIASAVITIEAAFVLPGAVTLARVISARAGILGGLVLIAVRVALATGIV